MLEMLLSGKKSGAVFPDSGPGAKKLIAGNKTYGFFGEVSEADMMVNAEFSRLLLETSAQNISVDVIKNVWLKFVIDEKFLFFPKLPLAGDIAIADLYAMKAVFDTDEQYVSPTILNTGVPMYSQGRFIKNGTNLFKLRLMDAIPTNWGSSANFTPVATSEVARLLAALYPSTYPDTLGIATYKVSDFSTSQGMSFNTYSWIKEVFTPSLASQFVFIPNSVSCATYSNPTFSWRPVLELVPQTATVALVIQPEKLSISNQGVPSPVSVSGMSRPGLMPLSNFVSVVDTQPVAPSGASVAGYQLQPMQAYSEAQKGGLYPVLTVSLSDEIYKLYGMSSAQPQQVGYGLPIVTAADESAYRMYDILGAAPASISGFDIQSVSNISAQLYDAYGRSSTQGYLTAA